LYQVSVRLERASRRHRFTLLHSFCGKVRFFGGNLKATYDFAKKAASVAEENISPE